MKVGPSHRLRRLLLAVLTGSLLATTLIAAQREPQKRVVRGAERSAPVTPVAFDGDVRDLPAPPQWQPGDPVKDIPRRFYPDPRIPQRMNYEPRLDPLLALQEAYGGAVSQRAFGAPSRNFPGQGYTGVNPPDTVGDVGPNHYIQSINSSGGSVVQIYDKALPTPNVLASFSMDSLATGACASGYSDPIVLYDRQADRWMISEFATSGNNLCVYVSQTPDPVSGGWNFYQFTTPTFPDYPKYAVWPTDANGGQGSYVVTSNDGGPGVYALDRGAMLAGAPATYQRMSIPDLPGFGFEAPTPADPDGPTPPPANAPALIMRHRDTENHSGPVAPGDLLEMWSFDVDWVTTANTTLSAEPSIDVSEFDSDLCGLSSFSCFPMPGTSTTLDPLREVIMFRLQYINHGSHESLVGNLVTDVDGSDHGGLRWFELRRSGGAWSLFQEGTYAPDADNRWMASSAMDQSGNIAIGYSVSSSSTYPSLRYTGRLASDTPGVMTQGEISIHAGTASNASNRWGDYAAMNVDPTDDCTFWFTSMDNTSSSWRTQIASFAFDACGCDLEPSPLSVTAADVGPNEIEVGWNDADLNTVVEYSIWRSFTSGGPYENIATVADTSPGIANGPGYFYSDTTVSGGSTYYYIVRATDGSACTSDDSNEASALASGACILAPDFAGLLTAVTPYSGLCTIDLSWNAATAYCGGPIEYNVYRSTSPGFTPGPGTLLAGGVNSTTFSDVSTLTSDVSYYYVVRAVDQGNAIEEGNSIEVQAVPQGPLTSGTWVDDAGDSGTAKLSLESPWHVDPSEGNLGPNVYKTGSYGNNICSAITTPPLLLGSSSMLGFSSQYEIENSYDKGIVEISTDGVAWQRVEVGYPGNSTNATDSCGLPTGSYFTGSGLSWAGYSADLSAWGNQTVMLRFDLSTDVSVNGTGWWVDDISITQVDVPGTCTTGSACADNPFINVQPDGPIGECLGQPQMLTANLSGGTGPFVYQWTRDGIDIPGENGPTLTVSDLGAHTYNCKVRANSCPDDVFDGIPTAIEWFDTPFFDGLQSATDLQQSTCGVDLAWNAASSVCPGPVTYSIYRDTSSPVSAIPSNLIVAGIGGTSHTDTDSLAFGSTYHYLVRAVDQSTGMSDANVQEQSAAPSGPGGGPQVVFTEDFEDAVAWSAWTVTNGPGPHTCGDWERVSLTDQQPNGSTGLYALSDSDACGSGSTTSTILDSPVINADLPGTQSVTLEFDMFYNYYNGDDATVEVWDGAAWQVIWADADADVNAHQSFDVTAFAVGNPNFRVRFNYQNAAYDWWFAVDNVVVTSDVSSACQTAAGGPAPPPVPDGSAASTPLGGDRASLAGDVIDVRWDATSCPATSYVLLYGDLADVSSYTLGGAECSIGTSGTYTWTGVPAGDLYFLAVGTDGAGTESSWGDTGGMGERNGGIASGLCSNTVKNSTATCP